MKKEVIIPWGILFLLILGVGVYASRPWIVYQDKVEYREVIRNVTVFQNVTEPQIVYIEVPMNVTEDNSTVSEPPRSERKTELPKYDSEIDFTVEVKVSSTPAEYTPWTGNGVPFINVYYRRPDGTAFNDTGMLHNGFVVLGAYTGYDVCDGAMITFWKWRHTLLSATDLTNRSLVYWSEPVPDDPLQLLGSGQNCYTRATVGSSWFINVCYEGDGKITPHWKEEVEGRTIDHFDFVDDCFKSIYTFPG